MAQYKVVEMFSSINGEGKRAGQLAVFVRFQGCNLKCSYCDTKWANQKDTSYRVLNEDEIYEYICNTKIKNVTLTGGEPLLQNEIGTLLELLSRDDTLRVEVETNGSVPIDRYGAMDNRPSMTMDYKLPSSGMEQFMHRDNLLHLRQQDTVKFVCGSMDDLMRAREVICENHLTKKCSVYLSPVYGKIDMQKIVEFMIEQKMNDVNLQLQMHKFIWDPNERGV